MPIAIGTLAMLVGNVGLQIFNNWSNSRQNDKLQQKREEFERAARDHQTERMWQILREGQVITLELEQNRQKQRLAELESEMAQLLKNLTYQQTISNWPLSVLPIVMKNQALGNLLAHQNESYALHCILTPSNSPSFNKHVFPFVEQSLESYCNQYWSANSSHPVLFYSGAWASNDAPTATQISSMQAALSNLPTMLITPFFRPDECKLIFQVIMWGVGATSDNHDFQNIWEIEPTDFRREYLTNSDYDKEELLLEDAINDIVPYLQCLIGYMADTYFWSFAGFVPHLPTLITNGAINTVGMKYLFNESRKYYNKLLIDSEEKAEENPFAQENLVNLYEGIADLLDKKTKRVTFEKILMDYIDSRTGIKHSSISELDESDCKLFETHVIDKLIHLCPNNNTKTHLYHIRETMAHQPLNLKIKRVQRLSLKELIENSCEFVPTNADDWHLFIEDINGFKLIVAFFTKDDDVICNQQSDVQIYITKLFAIPQNLNMVNGIDITIDQLKEISNHLTYLSM